MGKRKWLVLVVVVIAILVGVGTLISSQAKQEIKKFEESRPLAGALLYDQNGVVIQRLGQGSVFVPLEKIPQTIVDGVKVSEDKNFAKELGLGASKNQSISHRTAQLIFEPKGAWDRLKFAVLPQVLQRRYKQDELVELYLNHTYFGEGAHGVEAASQTYFAKPVEEVDLEESALLVALALEPDQASPVNKPKRATELRNGILASMVTQGLIKKDEYNKAVAAPLKAKEEEPGQAHYFADYLSKILVDKLGEDRVFQGGLQIETTLDLKLQKLGEQIVQKYEYPSALVVLDPKDGKILAMVGGLNHQKETTNLATTKEKEVGTVLRPLIYALGLKEKDWAQNQLVEDVQRKFKDLEVKNAGDRYWGPVTMKHALAMDLNNAAVWTLDKLGTNQFKSFLETLNLKLQPEDSRLELAMGKVPSGLNLLELTQAYSMGLKGVFTPAHPFKQVKDGQGQVILKNAENVPKRILSEEQAFLFTDLLMASNQNGTTKDLELDFPAALTASTSQTKTNQWCIGYTSTLLVGVLVHLPDAPDQEIPDLVAGEIWLDFMNSQSATFEEFVVPKDVETDVPIDVFTGLLANEHCPQVEIDAFIKGTKPTQMAPCAIPPAPKPPSAPPVTPVPPTTTPQRPAPPVEPEPPPPPVEPEEPPTESKPIEPVPPGPESRPPPVTRPPEPSPPVAPPLEPEQPPLQPTPPPAPEPPPEPPLESAPILPEENETPKQ